VSQQNRLIEMTASIVSGLVAGRPSLAEEVPSMLDVVHDGLKRLQAGDRAVVEARDADGARSEAQVSASSPQSDVRGDRDLDRETGFTRDGVVTVTSDHIVCLDDGRSVVFLKRHLKSIGVDLGDYLKRHGLPEDYPTTSPAYVAEKRRLAKAQGLGKSLRAGVGKSSKKGGGRRIPGTLSAAF
jgi:predicted transcriptional regulator